VWAQAALRKPAVPRRLNAPTPNVGDRRRRQPRTNGVSFVHGYSGRRASRDVVAHFFESGQRRVYVGPSRERTANGRRSTLASTGYIAAIDEKAWRATSARPGRPGFPTAWAGIAHGDSSRAEYASARSSHPFGAGLDRSQLRPPGQL